MSFKIGKVVKVSSRKTWINEVKKQSADWEGWLKLDAYPWGGAYRPVTLAAVSRDAHGLNIYMRSYEKKIRFEGKNRNDFVCQDSCMEFFFAPMGPEKLAYFNFELNPKGVAYIGFSADGTRAGSQQAGREQEDAYFEIEGMNETEATQYNEKNKENNKAYWELSYCIPYVWIKTYVPEFDPAAPNKKISANFYKCGDLTDTIHYGAWNSLTSEKPDFHRPKDFGILQFD